VILRKYEECRAYGADFTVELLLQDPAFAGGEAGSAKSGKARAEKTTKELEKIQAKKLPHPLTLLRARPLMEQEPKGCGTRREARPPAR